MPERPGVPGESLTRARQTARTAASGLIARPGLLGALDRATEHKVTVVSAPAGSGKTTLLRAWTEKQRPHRRIAFVTVRPQQQDAQQFWLAVLAVLRSFGGGAEPPRPSPGFNGPAMVDRIRSELASAADPIVLIIDDLHELASTEATEQLTSLLTTLPANAHAVVATRRDTPLRLHQLRLAGELAEIRAGQFQFSVDETRALLATGGIALADPTVAALHQRTEGWAAGLRLALLSLVGNPEPDRFVAEFSGNDRMVAEYLIAEMLDRQPSDVQHLLLRTCLLDRVNGELADLLTGSAGSEKILLDLEDANAFVVSLDPVRTWFRYHHLFRDLLRLELRRIAPSEIPELHRLAAQWLEEHGDVADAIRHLQAAGDWSEAADRLTDEAVSLTLDGQAATASALLRAFPAGIATESPGLSLVHAIADLDHPHLDQADAHLAAARAYAATTAPARKRRLTIAIAALDLLAARLRGHFDGVLAQVEALLTMMSATSDVDVALSADLQALAFLNLGVTEAWSMRLADSRRHLADGAALAHDIGRPYLEVACLAHLGFAVIGESNTRAKQHCHDAITLAARYGWDNEPVIAPAVTTLAGILIVTGEFERGELWLERARRVTPAAGEPGLRLLLHMISAYLPAIRGQHDQALAELATAARVQQTMAGSHALTPRVIAWTIATLTRLGRLDEARATLAAVTAEMAETVEIRNAAATLRLAEHDPHAAQRELAAVLDGRATGTNLAGVEAHLLDAMARRDLGDESGAQDAVEHALDLAEPDRLILPFAMVDAASLLAAQPRRTAHAAFVQDIHDVLGTGGVAERPATAIVEQLSPTELRVLRFLPTNLTRPEIAEQLAVSVNTVNTHIRRIYSKLGATDRSTAVQRGRELRLLAGGRVAGTNGTDG